MPIRSSLGSLVTAFSFIIYQIIIFRIIVEYDQLRYSNEEIKAKKARTMKRLMYLYMTLYASLVIIKIYFDI